MSDLVSWIRKHGIASLMTALFLTGSAYFGLLHSQAMSRIDDAAKGVSSIRQTIAVDSQRITTLEAQSSEREKTLNQNIERILKAIDKLSDKLDTKADKRP